MNKGLAFSLTFLRAQCRSGHLKSTQTICNRKSFANFIASASEAGGLVRYSPGRKTPVCATSSFSLYLAKAS